MAIVRWDPFREFAQLQDRLNRVIGEGYGRPTADEGFMTNGEWVPPVELDDQPFIIHFEGASLGAKPINEVVLLEVVRRR